nr:DNA-directed RNA polymerase subunit beta' [bacterium]
IRQALNEVARVNRQHEKERSITARERYNKVLDIWTHAANDIKELVFRGLEVAGDDPGLNPLFMMVDSGARGSQDQVQQLAGMRGLMAKPSGEVIENPITANFREGLSVLQYFISTHGARKGLADTALKTADSGYLTRRLVDVAQDMIITTDDCGTIKGRTVRELVDNKGEVAISLGERLVGRFSLETIKDRLTGEVVVGAGEEITEEIAAEIERLGLTEVRIRSVLTCEAENGVCTKCYGRNLAVQQPALLGDAVGIIAAQSIGEPGTQLTMRTFHIGGTASLFARRPEIISKYNAVIQYDPSKCVEVEGGNFKVLQKGEELIFFESDKPNSRELDRYKLEIGTVIRFPSGGQVKKKDLVAEWDPYNTPILTDKEGEVLFIDIVEGETLEVKKGADGKVMERVIVSPVGQEKHPQIAIRDARTRSVLGYISIPTGAVVDVEDGQAVKAGDRLARTPRKMSQTKDITGGLPRVAELFEARRPKDAAEIARISGLVEFKREEADEKAERKGKRRLIVKDPATGTEEEHLIPMGKHIIVRSGDWVEKGQQLTEGPIVLHELLDVCGMEALQEYLVNQVQEVYRAQSVKINDKHIEVIVSQMLGKVRVVDPGDTVFLFDEQVDRFTFLKENRRVRESGGRPAKSKNLLLGITKASLATESFISAASFQETTRILTDAAASGKVDYLKGFKENVIMGHLIPAGTGFPALKSTRVSVIGEEKKPEIPEELMDS